MMNNDDADIQHMGQYLRLHGGELRHPVAFPGLCAPII